MKTMKRFYFLAMMLAAGIMTLTLTACGDDDNKDNDGGAYNTSTDSGLIGWYRRQNSGNLEDWAKDGQTLAFDSEGRVVVLESVPWMDDVLEFNISELATEPVYYIPDDETFIKYTGQFYKENSLAAGNKELLFRYYCVGLGYVGVYAESTQYYTYWREGNKLYTTEDGWTVYTVTSSGIIPDGTSTLFSKYNPSQEY